jgi:hypothetical protein
LEHIVIYWIGAMAGNVVAFLVYPAVRDFLYANKSGKAKTN